MDFIDNTDLLIIDTNNNEDDTLFGIQNQVDFINYYIVDRFTRASLVGKAQNIPSRNLVMRVNDVMTNVSAHELGHCLNLLHTHHPGGDKVTDTPLDPDLRNRVNAACQYTGGGEFNPLTNNIMSYSRIECLTDFTNGQGYRMRYALSVESVLQNITNDACASISEVNNVCYPQTKTISLANTNGALAVWTSSNNVQIVSRNHSGAQIRALSTNSTGNGWVRATLSNGITTQEDFSIGTPPSDHLRIITTGNGIYVFSKTWQELFAHGGDNVEWSFSTSVLTRNGDSNLIMIYPKSTTGSLRVGIRAKNDCGYSNWYYKDFTIYEVAPDGGIGIMH